MFRLWKQAYAFIRTAYRPEQKQQIKVRSSVQLEAETKGGRVETSKVHSHVNIRGSRCMAKPNGEGIIKEGGGQENIYLVYN